MAKNMQITQHKRLMSFGTPPNTSFSVTSFMLALFVEILIGKYLIIDVETL